MNPRDGKIKPTASGRLVPKPTPAAPPVYRPQPVPKVLQRKSVSVPQLACQTRRPPVVSPAHRPQFTPRVLQEKAAVVSPPAVQRSVAQAKGGRNMFPPVIQRAKEDPLEQIREDIARFSKKRKVMQKGEVKVAAAKAKAADSGALDIIANIAFSGLDKRATGAVALINGTYYFAGQEGRAFANIEAIKLFFSSKTCEAADKSVPSPNMHAEMLIIYHCFKQGIDPKGATIGVKDKGCCRLCSAALDHLGITYTKTQASIFEAMWVDPWEKAGLKSPFGEGSGVPRELSQLV
jgi:hypothetical protein